MTIENKGFLALDTEFVWNRTYYARLGLVQAMPFRGLARSVLPLGEPAVFAFQTDNSVEARAVLLDPERCDTAGLRELLESERVVKVLHDAVQDLQHLARWTQAQPKCIFDTRKAAGFCGLASTISLAKLVEELLGLVLPKSETLTNWLQRPLTARQLQYAAQDVAYMDTLVDKLLERSKALGTQGWLLEEMDALNSSALYQEPPEEQAWKRLRVPPRPFRVPQARLRLRELAAWRERLARSHDLPRKWIADDPFLIDAAIQPPKRPVKVSRKELSPSFVQAFEAVLEHCEVLAAQQGIAGAPPEEMSAAERAQRDWYESRETKNQVKKLLEALAKRAGELGLDPLLFGSRAEVTEYLRNPEAPTHPLNSGWRAEALGECLRGALPAQAARLL